MICSACCLDAEAEQASGSGCYASQLTELIPLQGISAAGQAIREHTSLCLVTTSGEVCFAGFFFSWFSPKNPSANHGTCVTWKARRWQFSIKHLKDLEDEGGFFSLRDFAFWRLRDSDF